MTKQGTDIYKEEMHHAHGVNSPRKEEVACHVLAMLRSEFGEAWDYTWHQFANGMVLRLFVRGYLQGLETRQ